MCSSQAAYQYGMKVSDGRKTKGKIGQKNEKAKLDKEWNKVIRSTFWKWHKCTAALFNLYMVQSKIEKVLGPPKLLKIMRRTQH